MNRDILLVIIMMIITSKISRYTCIWESDFSKIGRVFRRQSIFALHLISYLRSGESFMMTFGRN